jgi:hypothetical protein
VCVLFSRIGCTWAGQQSPKEGGLLLAAIVGLGQFGSLVALGSLASAEVWDPLPLLMYCTVRCVIMVGIRLVATVVLAGGVHTVE